MTSLLAGNVATRIGQLGLHEMHITCFVCLRSVFARVVFSSLGQVDGLLIRIRAIPNIVCDMPSQ